jgi:hypothetical protein
MMAAGSAVMPFLFENRVGRLIVVRLETSMSLDDAQQLRTRMWATLGGMTGRAVMFGDMQRTEMFTPEVAEKLIAMLKHDTPKVERTAFLLKGTAGFSMQVERMIAEAAQAAQAAGKNLPQRRTFRDVKAARSWLDEALGPAERAALLDAIDSR